MGLMMFYNVLFTIVINESQGLHICTCNKP